MTSVIELDQATVTRQGTTILDSVTWASSQGEHWVVLGPNGAGKTTLVRAICGRCDLDAGTVRLDGADISRTDPSENATRVGFMSNSLANKLRPTSTVRDVVRSAAWGVHVSFGEEYEMIDDERADNLMALFGIAELADRRWSTVSQGEAQRALLARALMTDPEVLILDEPAAGLDLGAREMLVSALDEIIADPRGPQVILVTHQIEEIPSGITHALLMANGSVLNAGPIDRTLTGVNLSAAFDLPLLAGQREGRWWARGVGASEGN
ncbi:ATP-binding cassette domain-containing protein [Schaalia sp. ZJ1691]|uniref:ABC transporter ATP-binding protein n=1 Tax=Schaalia sp. ZJ1691 TaxID=2709404 RepID=UPI0013EA3AE6|nr:ATP-binding cassette domain-containing protein [Schaalia sp. ZJ1691]